MSQIALRINNATVKIESADVPATSDASITLFAKEAPNSKFPVCENDHNMHKSSLKQSIVQLEQFGAHLGFIGQVALSIVAIAGVLFLGMAALSVVAAATNQAILLAAVGVPLVTFGSYVLYNDEKRDGCRQHVELLFAETLKYYLQTSAGLKVKIDALADEKETEYGKLLQSNRDGSREYLLDPRVQYLDTIRAKRELDLNLAYFNKL